jgi:spermidine synthase
VSVVLIRYLDALQISLLLALVNLVAAACLGGIMMGLPVVAFVLLASLVRLDAVSLAWPWRGFELVDVSNSVYGNLVLVGREGTDTLYENGLAVVTVPDPEAAEEAVHYALLEHPAPSSLLLIGGGTNGSLAEALKHPGLRRVDYVELDPAILELADRHFSAAWSRARNDPRVHVHDTDGRLLLQTTAETFDVIIVSLPDPQTAQLNRFYTVEFFRQAARRLRPGGVFSFQLTSAENYVSPELAALLRCIYKTLGAVFPQVAFLPGNTVHYFASNRAGQLVTSAGGLLERLRARGIQTTYVREYFIPFRMMPDRMTSLAAEIRPRAATPVNRDFAPIAYYFDAVLWSKRFGRGRWMEPLGYATLVGAFALALILTLRRRPKEASAFAAGAMGFSMIGLEILLLLGFQALHGYVYHQLAMLIAMFMTGMAAGSWLGLRCSGHDLVRLAAVQCATAAAPLLLCLLLERHAAAFLFPVLALGCGLLGGYQFPVASRVFFADKGSPGSLYALDLAGSSLGAVLFSAWLIPLFGFWSAALVMAAMSLASVLPVLRAQGR